MGDMSKCLCRDGDQVECVDTREEMMIDHAV